MLFSNDLRCIRAGLSMSARLIFSIRIAAVSRLKNKGGAETGIKDYQYNYLSDNFKVVVMNFKSTLKIRASRPLINHLEICSNNDQ